MYKKISDYGIIGNLRTVALIGLDGSIDWLCLPDLDSPSIFAALLDKENGGRFSISPMEDWDSVAEYVPGTNILTTKFRTASGVLRITDFMPVTTANAEHGSFILYRLLEVDRGEIVVNMAFDPHLDYGRAKTLLSQTDGGIVARSDHTCVWLSC